jgi:hypothetical protein
MIVEPAAQQELLRAALWYEEQREGLGEDLLLAIDDVLIFVAVAGGVRVIAIAHEKGCRAIGWRVPDPSDQGSRFCYTTRTGTASRYLPSLSIAKIFA